MSGREEKVPEQAALINLEVLTADEYQESMADRIETDVFQNKNNVTQTAGLIQSFVQSYEQHKNELPLDKWLSAEFKKHPDIWQDEEEIQATTLDVINTITLANQNKASLQAHLDRGQSQASWLAKEIEKGAAATGAVNVGTYAGGIERALEQANNNSLNVITRRNGGISQAINLDGFIAEHHHADTFNIDAAAKGSAYRAKVLEPAPGETYGKNSMDIGIYDGNGKLVRRYQSKYGKDPKTSADLFEKGDYRGQRKLVPAGHGDANSCETIEIDGISSESLSKENARALRDKAQQYEEARQYDWNDTSRTIIAKQIGKQALMGAYITAGMQGGRILARRFLNTLTGKTNASVSEDLQEFFVSSLKGATHVGVQVAVSGGLVVAVKNGWLGAALKNTPAGRIANIVFVAVEDAKVLYKLSQGELTKEQALDAIGQTTTVAVGAIVGTVEGAALGANIGLVLGPIGAAVGGFVGGVAGGIAGSTIGQNVYEGGKALAKTAVNAVKNVASTVYEGVKSMASGFSNLVTSLNPFSW